MFNLFFYKLCNSFWVAFYKLVYWCYTSSLVCPKLVWVNLHFRYAQLWNWIVMKNQPKIFLILSCQDILAWICCGVDFFRKTGFCSSLISNNLCPSKSSWSSTSTFEIDFVQFLNYNWKKKGLPFLKATLKSLLK